MEAVWAYNLDTMGPHPSVQINVVSALQNLASTNGLYCMYCSGYATTIHTEIYIQRFFLRAEIYIYTKVSLRAIKK